MKNYIKTKLKIEEVLVKLQNGENLLFGINKEDFKKLKIYEGQFFMRENGEIGILENLKDKIKIIPRIKNIRIYEK